MSWCWMGTFLCLALSCPTSHPSNGGPADGGPIDGGQTTDGGTGADGGTSDGGSNVDAGPGPSPIGVYALTESRLSVLRDAGLLLAMPYVDGVLLNYQWDDVEGDAGVYSWQNMDADIQLLLAAGKKAELAVGGGLSSPSWVCQPDAGGAQCLYVTYAHADADNPTPSCDHLYLPVPWDSSYHSAFAKMLGALSQHLEDAGEMGSVATIKLTGINLETNETLLPLNRGGPTACGGGDACVDGGCVQSDILAELVDAGFDAGVAVTAFLDFAADFLSAFPFSQFPIGSEVSASFPSPFEDAGTLPFQLDVAFVQDHVVYPITVQDDGLTADAGIDPGTLYALNAGVPVGYQMLGSVQANACAMWRQAPTVDGGCPPGEVVLMDAIGNGLAHGARWLEIYSQDLFAFPDAGIYAHSALTRP
jgi:hypothetical protein